MLRYLRGLGIAACLAMPFVSVSARAESPAPVDAIFNARHLDLVNKGSNVLYKFDHKVSDEKLLGQGFSDDIKINVTDVTADGSRVLDVTVFTGDRQRPVQNYDGLSINPVFVWFLDKAVENLRIVAGGKQPYLKGRMRDAFLDKAKIEPVKFNYAGKEVEGFKVTMVPFENDPNKHKMQGFEKSSFSFTFSKDVPGYFYELDSDIFSSQAGTASMKDRIVLVEATP
ncbi:MAG: hypothetical protein ACM3L9_00820 [Deltaproteobacteria bacterium]